MNVYDKYCLPHFINCVCGLKPIIRQRRKVVPVESSSKCTTRVWG